MKEYISIDVETTGFSPEADRIVELGAVRFLDDHEEIGRFSELVNPYRFIPEKATEIHGITDDMVKDARPFSEVIKDFLSFIGKSTPLLAHNSSFDARFITTEMRRCFPNHKIQHFIIDTLALARRKNRLLPSYSLPYLVREYGLEHTDFRVDGAHRALLDCLHVKNLWLKLEGPAEPSTSLTRYRICNHGK